MDVVAGAGAFCADGRAAVVSLLEARLFGLPASYWAPIATLVITQPSLGRTLHGLSHFIGLPKMAKRVADLLVDVLAEGGSPADLRCLRRLAQRHYRLDSSNQTTGMGSSAA
jgi:hypothetical protein